MIGAGIHSGDVLVVDRSPGSQERRYRGGFGWCVRRSAPTGSCVFIELRALWGYEPALYGNPATILSRFGIYSVDEAFLSLSGFRSRNFSDYAGTIRSTLKRWTACLFYWHCRNKNPVENCKRHRQENGLVRGLETEKIERKQGSGYGHRCW
jgi:hypothetical protein